MFDPVNKRRYQCQTEHLFARTAPKNLSSPKVNKNSTRKKAFKMSPNAALIAVKQKRLSLIVTDADNLTKKVY
jgi:hypothetical protein